MLNSLGCVRPYESHRQFSKENKVLLRYIPQPPEEIAQGFMDHTALLLLWPCQSTVWGFRRREEWPSVGSWAIGGVISLTGWWSEEWWLSGLSGLTRASFAWESGSCSLSGRDSSYWRCCSCPATLNNNYLFWSSLILFFTYINFDTESPRHSTDWATSLVMTCGFNSL